MERKTVNVTIDGRSLDVEEGVPFSWQPVNLEYTSQRYAI